MALTEATEQAALRHLGPDGSIYLTNSSLQLLGGNQLKTISQ